MDGEITDKDGNPIIDKPLPIRDDAIKTIFNVIKEGRGTEHGGVYYDTTVSPKSEEEISQLFKDMTPKHYRFLKDAAGIDAANQRLEVAPASHYQCGGIYINERGESSINGLYACGEVAGNFQGANRLAGSALCDTQTMGAQVGGCAADDAAKGDLIPVEQSAIDQQIDFLQSFISDKQAETRPVFIKEEILKTMDDHVAPFRDEKGLQQGLAAIESLKAQVPKISVADIKRYNFELKEALETSFALDAAEITIGSCLYRTESRGHHNRTDFPDMDDKNWRCHTIVKQEDDKPVYSKRDVIYTRLKPED